MNVFTVTNDMKKSEKGFAPGEARTHGLQIMRLTRCLLRYRGLVMKEANFVVPVARDSTLRERSLLYSA